MRTIMDGQVVLFFTLGCLATRSHAVAVKATNSSSSSSQSSESTASTTSISITVPLSDDSANAVSQDFPAFAFEEASFVNYILDANGNINTFSQNLIDVVTSRTGGTPIVRLGGTSADYAKYDADQTIPALPLATDGINYDVGNTTIGPSFWQLTSLWPDAEFMIQVPLATTDVNETILWVQTAVDNIASDQIHSIEIGNEPDWYSSNYQGTDDNILGPPEWQSTFTNETYVGNYTKYLDAIVAAVELPTNQIFQAFDTAAHVAADSSILCYLLDVGTCMDLGIDDSGYLKTVAHHYYQNSGGTADELATGKGLMNMTFTHWRMDFFHCQIDWLAANRPNLPFVLSEVGNSLPDVYEPWYQAVLGSALWQVDFYLYAMALGISRVHYQQMFAETYQPIMWLPVEYLGMAPHVTANFYSQPFIGDFVGSSGATTMSQLDISPAQDNVAAYVAYESGSAARVAVVNLNYWNETSSSGAERSNVNVAVSVPDSVESVTLSYLSSPLGAGADATTITYGGSQWTYESDGIEVTGVRNDTETLVAEAGVVTVAVNASSAVLIFF